MSQKKTFLIMLFALVILIQLAHSAPSRPDSPRGDDHDDHDDHDDRDDHHDHHDDHGDDDDGRGRDNEDGRGHDDENDERKKSDNQDHEDDENDRRGPEANNVRSKGRSAKGWSCTIEFYKGYSSVYSEDLDSNDSEAHRSKFSDSIDNKISRFEWDGDGCYCWVILYQSKKWNGLNIGFWIESDSGEQDLSFYTTYDQKEHDWERWDRSVSSYDIYCY